MFDGSLANILYRSSCSILKFVEEIAFKNCENTTIGAIKFLGKYCGE